MTMPRWLFALFLVIDLGFLAYWSVSALDLVPADWMFKDHQDPILDHWNWSFLPLDLVASATGMFALRRARRDAPWHSLAIVSLALTWCAGLQAVSFWFLRSDFDLAWWLPNLFLIAAPTAALWCLLHSPAPHSPIAG